jgi:hypothetical protein
MNAAKFSLIAIGIACAVVACGSAGGGNGTGGSRTGTGPSVDAGPTTVKTWDLSTAPVEPVSPDMASSGSTKLGCNGYIDCLSNQYMSNGGDFNAAETTCKAMTKATSVTKWETAVGCGQQYCVTQNACKLDAAMSQLVNQDGTPPNNGTPCGDCLSDALAGIFKGMCAGTMYCNPATCQTSVSACLNDTP